MMLSESILENWDRDIYKSLQEIVNDELTSYPAWTISLDYGRRYGVVIAVADDVLLNENFAGASIYTQRISLKEDVETNALFLISKHKNSKQLFVKICESLIMPGENGQYRDKMYSNPAEWWTQCKELLGNRNYEKATYDTLGELMVLRCLLELKQEPIWKGPEGASHDIELLDCYVEVKSTLVRDKKEVTINNEFQLNPPNHRLQLAFCQFEYSIYAGESIDDVVASIAKTGYNCDYIEEYLDEKGFSVGRSARYRKYLPLKILLYDVDENFPRITPESFVEGKMPEGINKIQYTVDLGNLPYETLFQGENT